MGKFVPHMICGYLLTPDSVEAWAAREGLKLDAADAATEIADRLGLYPRVRVMVARGKERNYMCLTVGTNMRSENLPVIEPDKLQKLKKFLGTDRDPQWYYKGGSM